MRARDLLLMLVLVATAAASWYLARLNKPVEDETPQYDSEHRGYYLRSARILGTAGDGGLLYEITADHAEQMDTDTIEFTKVGIRYSPESDVPWTVKADTATLRYDEQRVHLRGHVLARSEEGFSGDDTEVRTDYLSLDPEKFLAETDERVQIRIGERSITATGMRASLDENRLQLKSNVSGKFIP